MDILYLSLIIVLGILAFPMIFIILATFYSYITYLVIHFVYKFDKFDLFGVREKWLKDHPDMNETI